MANDAHYAAGYAEVTGYPPTDWNAPRPTAGQVERLYDKVVEHWEREYWPALVAVWAATEMPGAPRDCSGWYLPEGTQ